MKNTNKIAAAVVIAGGLLVSSAISGEAAGPTPGGTVVTKGVIQSFTCSDLYSSPGYCRLTMYGNSTKPKVYMTARIWNCSAHYGTPEGTYVGNNGEGLKYLVNSPFVSILWGDNRIGSIACY